MAKLQRGYELKLGGGIPSVSGRWRRHQVDPQRRLCLTLALPPEAAWRLRVREFAWINEFLPPGSIWRRRQHARLTKAACFKSLFKLQICFFDIILEKRGSVLTIPNYF